MHSANKRLTYNFIRWGATSHATLQFALGVLDSMLCGLRCDDRWAWCEEERDRKQSREIKKKEEDSKYDQYLIGGYKSLCFIDR